MPRMQMVSACADCKVRLLQPWLTLPKNKRWTAPDFQAINVNAVPVRHELGAEIQVYSGSSGGLHSGTRNHVPVIMVEINLEPHASAEQESEPDEEQCFVAVE